MNKDIIKGEEFLCIQEVEMNTGKIAYIEGAIYTSDEDGNITDEQGKVEHSWDEEWSQFFERVEQPITSLPEKWYVKCNSSDESNEVRSYVQGEEMTFSTMRHYVANWPFRKKVEGETAYVSCAAPSEGTELTFNQWKQLISKKEEMKKYIPEQVRMEKIAVWFNNREELYQIQDIYLNGEAKPEHWQETEGISGICSYFFEAFEGKEGYTIESSVRATKNSNYYKSHKYKVIDFNQIDFKETTMTKQPFSVTGSAILIEAYMKEIQSKGHTISNSLLLQHHSSTVRKVYNLGTQFDEAVQAFVDYWKEDEYKVGDIVCLTDRYSVHPKNTIASIEDVGDDLLGLRTLDTKTYLGPSKSIIRRATKEEIEAAQTIKLTLGSNSVEVVVKKGQILARGIDVPLKIIKDLHMHGVDMQTQIIRHWTTNIDRDVRFIQVGCNEEGNKFSFNDLKQVIDAYDKLNGK